jgi:hypothetical protein
MAAKVDSGKPKLPVLHDDDSGDEDLSRVGEGASEKSIKRACRLGLTNAERALMWVKLSGATNREDYYLAALEKVFGAGNIKPSKVYRVSLYVLVCVSACARPRARWQRHLLQRQHSGCVVGFRHCASSILPCTPSGRQTSPAAQPASCS